MTEPMSTPEGFGVTGKTRRVALISCGSQKLDHPAPAASLYTSTLFRKSVAYALATCDAWFVLSAKHGLVAPDRVIEPYDQKLTALPSVVNGRPVTTEWAGDVSRALLAEFGVVGVWQTEFVVLAGGAYEANLRTLPIGAVFPLAGLQIGERLHWLTERIPSDD